MVDDGYVQTRVHPTDKRQRYVSLTAKGRELERSLSPIVDAAFAPFSQVLSLAEQKTLVTILRKAADGVSRVAQEAQAAEAREASHANGAKEAKRTPRGKAKPASKPAAKRAPKTARR
jgi:hypothetical protein